MKLSVALFFAGLFGALAAVFILLSFGSDYWLLASETCIPKSHKPSLSLNLMTKWDFVGHDEAQVVTYNEGFFWGCYSRSKSDENLDLAWAHWFRNQPDVKTCFPAYLYPYPMIIANATNITTNYDPAIIYRGFWSVFMLISVAAVVLAGFLVICGAPFASYCLYKAGGGLLLVSGFFLLCDVVMYVLWFQLSDVLKVYTQNQLDSHCTDFQVSLSYGLSFMFAPIGVFFSLLSGLLFILIGRTVQDHC